MTIITNLIPLVPILVVIFSITLFRRSTRTSMLIGAGTALFISICQGTAPENIFHLSCTLMLSTLLDNWALFASLLVFGMFVYTITRSQAVTGLSSAVRSMISSRIGFLICVIACILICSSDDYLDAIIVCMALTSCASYYGISSARFAVLVNMLVASACTLLPSTWQPVISGSLASAHVSGINWQRYAFFPMINICLVLGYAVFGRTTVSSSAAVAANADTDENTNRSRNRVSVIAVLLSTTILAAAFAIFNLIGFEYALFGASIIALVVTVIVYRRLDLIEVRELRNAWREGLGVMGDLDFTLVTIWMFTGLMTDLLHLDQMIVALLQQFDVPIGMIPAIYFIGSAIFGYLTSSAFASFRVMIPLSAAYVASLGNDTLLAPMIIGATVSGSLFASLSLTSDTLILSTQSAGCDVRRAFLMQTRYTVMILLIGTAAYAAVGTLTYSAGPMAGFVAALLVIATGCTPVSMIYGRIFRD